MNQSLANSNNAYAKQIEARLFIAGDSINSRIARENLKRLQESLKGVSFQLEIVDVQENVQEALDNGVFLTPALQILKPEPSALVFGNLKDPMQLLPLFQFEQP